MGARRGLAVFLSGCSWQGVYHAGAAEALRGQGLEWHWLGGASSGSLVAAALTSGLPPVDVREAFVRAAMEGRRGALGPVGRLSTILEAVLQDVLPADAHQRCSGRLEVSLCSVEGALGLGLRNHRLDAWASKDDLVECLLMSCHIPLVSDRAPYFRGMRCIDGGFLGHNGPGEGSQADLVIYHSPDNHPKGMEGLVIHPRRGFTWWHALFPPDRELMEATFRRGTLDAEAWLRAHGDALP
mmetsp:Transcript_21251/g.59861  ORF Transcript_21251/g.59861 Transcript_21251/m.59861 type:complete len:241 (+) Transcript_21251:80-802(+)